MLETVKQLLANPPVEACAFWLCACLTVGAALVAAFARSIVRAAFSLFFTLFALAGLYILLGADFIGVVQVVVYIGGILALILFGVLLTHRSQIDLTTADSRAGYLAAGTVAAMLFVVLLAVIMREEWRVLAETAPIAATTRQLGSLLLSKFLLPFEFVSITLLIALLGACYLARRRDE